MTKLLDDVIEAVQRLSPEAQEAVATLLRNIVDDPCSSSSLWNC